MADELKNRGRLDALARRVAVLQAQIDDLQVEVRQTREEILALRPSVGEEGASTVVEFKMPESALSQVPPVSPVDEAVKPTTPEMLAVADERAPGPSKDDGVDRAQVRQAAAARLVRPAGAAEDAPPIVPAAAPPTAPPVPPVSPAITPPAGPMPAERRVNWEAVIGGNWLNRIGVVVLLLAGAFLAHLAWQRNWVSPPIQTGMIFIVGAALLVGGEIYQRRGVKIFAQGLTSLGIFALYAGGFVGYHLHHLLSTNATFAVFSVITAVSFLLAARTNSVAVVLLGMLGGYLTPVIVSTGQNALVELFTYVLFLNAAIAATSITKQWDFLQLIAFIATAAMFIGWGIKFYDAPQRWTVETLLAVHAGLFIVAGLFPYLVLGRETSGFARWVLVKASMTFFGVTYLLFQSVEGHRLGEFAAAYAVGHWLVAGAVYACRGRKDRLIGYLLGLGAIYITLAIPIYYSAHQLAVAWAIEALVFTILGVWYRNIRTLATATGVFALAALWTIGHDIVDAAARGDWWFIDARFGTIAIVAAALAGAALAYRFGRSRLAGLHGMDAPSVPFVFMIAGNVLLAAGAMHQFPGSQLELAYAANALIAAGLARWRRHESAGWFALIALLPAAWRFMVYEFAVAFPAEWMWQIDVRFARGLAVVAGVWATATLVRTRLRWEDLPDRSTAALVLGDVLLIIVASLQWHGQTLMAVYALNALGLAAFGRWRMLPNVAWSAVVAFGWAVVWWAGNLDGARSSADAISSFAQARGIAYGFIPGLVLVAAGWSAAALFRKREPAYLASVLSLGLNLVLLGAIALQWDGYLVLLLWTIDVAALWAIGFRFDYWAARAEAFALWLLLLCGWILTQGLAWPHASTEFVLLANARFGTMLLVALVGFCAGWAYRRALTGLLASNRPTATVSELMSLSPRRFLETAAGSSVKERHADWICAVLANGVFVLALTMEIVTRFAKYQDEGNCPFANWEMARQAAMSILWTSYAAVAFIVAFLLRYKPVRLLALISLGPILLKVFLVDLRGLDVIYRVLSFAVLGVVFLGISYLYQRYARRIAPE